MTTLYVYEYFLINISEYDFEKCIQIYIIEPPHTYYIIYFLDS